MTPPLLLPKSRSTPRLNSSSEWLHRTADALTTSARESKGQSWLTTRASSTSLVDEDRHDEAAVSPMWGAAEEEDYMPAAGYVASVRDRKLEEDEDEEAVGGAYRLGQIFDRLIGWSVFGEEESDDDSDGGGGGGGGQEEAAERKRREKERVRSARIRIAGPEEERTREEQRRRRDMDGGWQDPAWILSVASNVLF